MYWFCKTCFLESTSGYRRGVNSGLQKRWRLPFCPDGADSYWPTSYWPSSWLVGVGSEGRFQPRAALDGVCVRTWTPVKLNESETLKTLLLLTNGHPPARTRPLRHTLIARFPRRLLASATQSRDRREVRSEDVIFQFHVMSTIFTATYWKCS